MDSGGSALEEGSTRLLYRSRPLISAGMKIIALALLLSEALQCAQAMVLPSVSSSEREEKRSIEVRSSGSPFDMEPFSFIINVENMKEMCKSFTLGESSKPESKRSADPASPYGSLPFDPSKLTEWCDEIDKVYPSGSAHKEETRSIEVRSSGLPFEVPSFLSPEKIKEMCKSFKLGESSKPESKRSADPASPYGSLPFDPSKLTEWCDEIDKVYPSGSAHKEETRSIEVRSSGLPFEVPSFLSPEKIKEMCKSFKLGESSKPESKRSADPGSPYGSLPFDPSKLTEWCDEIDKVYPSGSAHKEETRSIEVRSSGLPFEVPSFLSPEKIKEMCKSFKLGESSKPESKRSADPGSPYGSLPFEPSKLTEWCDEIDKVYPSGGSHKEETRSIEVRSSGLPFEVPSFLSPEKIKEMCKSFKLGESSKPESKRSADPASPYGSLPFDPSKLTEWCDEIDKVYPSGSAHKEETRSIEVRSSGLPFEVPSFLSPEKIKEMCKSFKLGESSKPESKRSADPASPYGSLPFDPSKLTEWCDEIDKVYPSGSPHKEETRSIEVRSSGLPFEVPSFLSPEKIKEMCKSFKLGESSKPESKRSADPGSPYGSLPFDPSKLTEWCDEIDKVYPSGSAHKEETRSIEVRSSGLPFEVPSFLSPEKIKEMCKSFKLGESSKPESKRSADPGSPYGSLPFDPSKLTEWCDEIDKVYPSGGSHKEETRSIEVRSSGLPFEVPSFLSPEKIKEMCKSFKLGESSKPESKRSADPASPYGSLPFDPSKLTEWCDEIDKVYPSGSSHKEETRSIEVRSSGLPFDVEGVPN